MNLQPVRLLGGVKTRYKGINLVIVRKNTEEFWGGIEHYIDLARNGAVTIGIVTRSGTDRMIPNGYEYAWKMHRLKPATTVGIVAMADAIAAKV